MEKISVNPVRAQMIYRPAGIIAVAMIACVAACEANAQDTLMVRRDVITGRVTSDSTHGLTGIDVIISRAPDRAFLRTVTDSNGHYLIVFEQGTGDYLVHVSAPGMTTVRKRVTRRGSDSVFVVNVALKREGAAQLSAVYVTARRPTPSRNGDNALAPGTGAMEHEVDGVNGSISPDLAGNIAAMAGTIPSLLVTEDGVSAGGVSPQQNSTTLNGMSFPGAELPRDALAGVRVRTSVYDPAEGWFGGVQQAVELRSGVPLVTQHAHITMDAPFAQYTDAYSSELGQQFTNFETGLGGVGFVDHDRVEYNYGAQAGHRVADGISLVSSPPDVLERANIAPDSAARLLGTLRGLGVPLSGPTRRVTNKASFLGAIGPRPSDLVTFRPKRTVWSLVGYANTLHSTNIVSSPTATLGHSGSATNQIGALQVHYSTYLHDVYLVDLNSQISVAHASAEPTLLVPTGIVLVNSDMGDGNRVFNSVAFGGNTGLARDLTQSTWETAGNIKLYVPGRATHRVKIAADSRVDRSQHAAGSNTLGRFAFNSIEDVGLNQPISFTRMSRAPAQSASVWNGFLSFGDYWRGSDSFQMLYGVRLEGNRFIGAPAENRAVAEAFNQRTDFTPNTIHLSPRLGFSYTRRGSPGGFTENGIGRFVGQPTGYLRGGIGEFRTLILPALVAGASAMTGLASATEAITCVGAATPSPLWAQYVVDPSSIPTDCVGGAAQRAFVDAAPSVELLDRSYAAPRSWRANLVYGSAFRGAAFSVEGAYSFNLNQPGQTDLNFADRAQFTTSDEGRPVYVGAAAIVPRSGALVPTTSRRDESFGQVIDRTSNVRSISKQLTFSISPEHAGVDEWFASAAYTISDTRALRSGFDNTTFESPISRHWARGDFDSRHRIVVQGGVSKGGLTFTLFGRMQSGFPFTPMLGSDVNGDGYTNDRAFIFDPAFTTDSVVATGMRSLMQSSQRSVRECLVRQLRRAAAVNSCEGPWTASLNAQFAYAFTFPRTAHRSNLVLALTNPLGGLDQMLHGGDHLHGWGTSTLPNPILYNVRGFDVAAKRYLYNVNPRFGDTRPLSGVPRVPFGLTLDFSIDLSQPSDIQVVELQLKPGRNGYPGPRLSAAAIKRRYDVVMPDPFRAIMEESDSLMLSRSQVDALTDSGDVYRAQRDSVLMALSQHLAGLPDSYVAKDARRRQNAALDAVWDLGRDWIKRTLAGILNQYQLKMLPWPASRLYTAPSDINGMKLALP